MEPKEPNSRQERVTQNRHSASQRKYEQAVEFYKHTDMSLREIAKICQVSRGGLGNYLRRYHRELVFQRHNISVKGGDVHAVKILKAGQQSETAHKKYKNAVQACDMTDYIEYNVSQIAHKYHLDGTALANFMRVHYEDIPKRREKIRERLGINDNIHRGARKESVEQYAEAMEMYRTTDMTKPEVAEVCRISLSGFSQYLRFYHKEILSLKREKREQAQTEKKYTRGDMSGNGRKKLPLPATEQKYAEALALYESTALSLKEIVKQTRVSHEGFRSYLHKWHKDLVLERLGITGETDSRIDLRSARQRMKTVTAKYHPAIESLKSHPRPLTQVAAEFGLHPDTFRQYLRKHEPELADMLGMTQKQDGTRTLRSSESKYAEAIHLYETTTESLKSIAQRLDITYNSLGGYIRRNCPHLLRRHKTPTNQ